MKNTLLLVLLVSLTNCSNSNNSKSYRQNDTIYYIGIINYNKSIFNSEISDYNEPFFDTSYVDTMKEVNRKDSIIFCWKEIQKDNDHIYYSHLWEIFPVNYSGKYEINNTHKYTALNLHFIQNKDSLVYESIFEHMPTKYKDYYYFTGIKTNTLK